MQANVLFDTVKGRMGNANSSKYTGACFERWGCFSRRAVSVPFVDELPQTDEIVRIADALTDMSHINTVECVMRSMPVGGVNELHNNIRGPIMRRRSGQKGDETAKPVECAQLVIECAGLLVDASLRVVESANG